MIIIKTFGGFKSVLLADIIFKLHRLHIVYWQRKLKQFQLNMNHCRHYKPFEVLMHFIMDTRFHSFDQNLPFHDGASFTFPFNANL